jgi:hypothetical protein
MTVYADYNFYKNEYHGSMSSSLFSKYSIKATMEINRNLNRKLTSTEIANVDNEFKFVMCELCDLLLFENEENITSLSIDGVSKTFMSLNSDELKNKKIKILDSLPQNLTRYI